MKEGIGRKRTPALREGSPARKRHDARWINVEIRLEGVTEQLIESNGIAKVRREDRPAWIDLRQSTGTIPLKHATDKGQRNAEARLYNSRPSHRSYSPDAFFPVTDTLILAAAGVREILTVGQDVIRCT